MPAPPRQKHICHEATQQLAVHGYEKGAGVFRQRTCNSPAVGVEFVNLVANRLHNFRVAVTHMTHVVHAIQVLGTRLHKRDVSLL